MDDLGNQPKYSPELFQALILARLDQQHDAVRDLKNDIKDVQAAVSEIKDNHLVHLTADVAVLKDAILRNEKWIDRHEHSTLLIAREQERGRWEVWVAVIGGCLGIVAAIVTALLHKF